MQVNRAWEDPSALALVEGRIARYLGQANCRTECDIGEALLTVESPADSTQKFLPFVHGLRVGNMQVLEEAGHALPTATATGHPSTGIPALGLVLPAAGPSVPSTGSGHPFGGLSLGAAGTQGRPTDTLSGQVDPASPVPSMETAEPLTDVQVDYWALPDPKHKVAAKTSIKASFRCFRVTRVVPECHAVSPPGDAADEALASPLTPSRKGPQAFAFQGVIREKKGGLNLRLVKRARDRDVAVHASVSRLICTVRGKGSMTGVSAQCTTAGEGEVVVEEEECAWPSHVVTVFLTPHPPLWHAVVIDGVPWHNVRFFSLSLQWPTHTRRYPIATFKGQMPRSRIASVVVDV